jgi:hypothetical protein
MSRRQAIGDVTSGAVRLARGLVPLRRATPRRLVRMAQSLSDHGLTLAGLTRVASIRDGRDVVLVDRCEPPEVGGLAREADRQAQLEEAQAADRGDAPQVLGALAVEGRVAVEHDAQEARLIRHVHRVQGELDAVGEELLELGLDRVGDAAQTADGLALARRLRRQVRGALQADRRLLAHLLQLVGGALDEAHLLVGRGRSLAGRQARVQTPQTAPRAQVLLLVARAQCTGVLDGEF